MLGAAAAPLPLLTAAAGAGAAKRLAATEPAATSLYSGLNGAKRARKGVNPGGFGNSPQQTPTVALGAVAGAPASVGGLPPPDAPCYLQAVRGVPDWGNEGFLGARWRDLVRWTRLPCCTCCRCGSRPPTSQSSQALALVLHR